MTREAAGRLESETSAPFGLHNEHMCSRHEYKMHAHLSTKSDAFTHTTKWTQNLDRQPSSESTGIHSTQYIRDQFCRITE